MIKYQTRLTRRKIKNDVARRIKSANDKFNKSKYGRVSFKTNGEVYLFGGTCSKEYLERIIRESEKLEKYLDEEI